MPFPVSVADRGFKCKVGSLMVVDMGEEAGDRKRPLALKWVLSDLSKAELSRLTAGGEPCVRPDAFFTVAVATVNNLKCGVGSLSLFVDVVSVQFGVDEVLVFIDRTLLPPGKIMLRLECGTECVFSSPFIISHPSV